MYFNPLNLHTEGWDAGFPDKAFVVLVLLSFPGDQPCDHKMLQLPAHDISERGMKGFC
jgi:hypothetical protein